MRKHHILTQAFSERMCNALRKAPGIHENERRAVRQDEFRDTVVDLVPHLRARDRTERVARNFDGDLHLAPMSDIDDSRIQAQACTPLPRSA